MHQLCTAKLEKKWISFGQFEQVFTISNKFEQLKTIQTRVNTSFKKF